MNQNLYYTKLKSVRMNITHLIMPFMLVFALTFALFLVQTAIAQEVLVQTGFEEFTFGEPPTDWEVRGNQMQVTGDTVKTGDKSLGILGGANDDRVGVAIETENPIISVEFWVYIKGAGRSFNLKVVSADDIAQNDGGVYLNWNANATRLYNGSAWVAVDDFPFETWKYVRVVADVENSVFDYYVGDDRDQALTAAPKTDLAFRKPATNPVVQWIVFHVYSTVAQGFVDDLFVYEGAEPVNPAPVNPKGKLTTFWGDVKKHSSF